MTSDDERYFEGIERRLDEAFERAERAKSRGDDPEPEVEIPVARDMADRVENILGIDGVAERVRDLEGEMSREEAALELVTDFVEGTVGDYDTKAGKVEGAVRTAVALLTEGVVAAPIEGIDRVELLENDDGSEFVNVYYAGPIRSAGGTAQALSVLVADYARSLLDIEAFEPRDDEIERYAEEVSLYDDETGLQYTPKDKETKFIAEHAPIMLDGEATGDEEVSGFRDLERIDTNAARGGMCLVLAEGIALKAPKIQRYTRNLEEVEWPWLQDLIDGTIGTDESGDDPGEEDTETETNAEGTEGDDDTGRVGPPRVDPSGKYLRDLIAGRPVFGHPSESGGFRLRYGRARNHGFATAGVHPATMHLVDDFLAAGTQIKTERPGKAAGVVPVDTIEGPTVRLANGEVRRIDDPDEARAVRNGVEEIIDLGEYLVNYGEFVENNHPLAPASYTVEWWIQEFEASGADVQALRDDPRVDLAEPTPSEALGWATEFDCPLHPAYTYLWHDVSVDEFEALAGAVASGEVVAGGGDGEEPHRPNDRAVGDGGVQSVPPGNDDPAADSLVIDDSVGRILERLLVEHVAGGGRIRIPEWRPLARSLGVTTALDREWSADDLPAVAREYDGGENAIRAVEAVAPFTVRERAPTRIGNRMGRPEKSESRDLSPAVHTLFPIGEAGGSQRDVGTAATARTDEGRGVVSVEVGRRVCDDCGGETYRTRCPDCGTHTEPVYECGSCGRIVDPDESGRVHCDRCDRDVTSAQRRALDVGERYREALEAVGEREAAFEILKGVKGLTSANKTPEPMEKGVLRAKHGVSAFKDGTVRYDMTDLPVTAVRPEELDVTAEDLRELGYETDIDGDPLRFDDQLVELKVQDVVLSDGAADHLLRTADFVDDLLTEFYDLPAFYEVEERSELVGELVFGMAPHTSAAVVGRVVGFTSASVGYAHPYFHAAKRRNCFHPETKVWYRDEDGAWNHERIGRLVEDRLDPETVETDDFGTLVQELDSDVHVPSIDADGGQVLKPVEAVSKHHAPDHLVEIETRSGREITVTPDHEVLRWSGGIERIEACKLEAGDELPPPLDAPPTEVEETAAAAADGGRANTDAVTRVRTVRSAVDHTYCLTVADTHTLYANDLPVAQCDGDEDCVMLLMDGLLNFSREYLPDQRGGSVAADSRLVAVSPEGDVRFMTVESFWEELGGEVVRDGKFRKKPCLSEGWQTYVFDDDHRASLAPIEKAIRYPADGDEMLLRVETQFGRSLDITADHSLFRYDDGIEEVAGEDLEEGDLVLAPRQLDVDPVETTVDVAEVVDDPYVFIDDHVEDLLRTVWESTDHGSDAHDEFMRGLSYRLAKRKIGYERFERILNAGGFEGAPGDVTMGRSGSETGIDREIDVDEEFAWLLGLFVAEGTLSSTYPAIHNSDERIVERARSRAESALGHDPSIRWSNRTYELRFPTVFEDVLHDLGFVDAESYDSSEKVIPESILRAPRETVLAFLRGFIAGDGSDSTDDNVTTVGFHTTSEDVKDGIVFLLLRLGLVANVSVKTERDGNRQDLYTVTVSGGAGDNPLHRVLDGDEPYHSKSLVVSVPDALMALHGMEIEGIKRTIPKYLKRRENVSLEKLREIVTDLDGRDLPETAQTRLDELRPLVDGDLSYLRVQRVEEVDYEGHLYDLQVGGEPIFTANWLYAHNSMDAPLVMSSRIDPTEIDDEAHNMDVVREYPREFYEATREMADPEDVDVEIAEASLGTDSEYHGFDHTHDTTDIALGPDLSAYKTLGSMMEKMDAQLELARKLRAVDETDVAERVIEYHFLPDLIGNLRAFSRQKTRCLDCGKTYRRAPLSGDCRECGGRVNLTVHEGSVNKYMDTAIEVAEEFGCRPYTKQRLEVLEKSLESVFQNDRNKPSRLDDFM
ncbi:LAGLIDADG family homing endonuclease [Haloplanus salilacus]|uniref:LAGLIDADG family homing endonuclease n=1 Tax=Haloplanus salilacus TaxID=2949994 RepID=UPI0030D5AB96